MQTRDLIEVLEKEYPNDVIALTGKTHEEMLVYLAQIELIEFIKRLEKDN